MRGSARALLVFAAVVLVTGFLAAPVSAAVPKCFGEKATIVGTSGDDVIRGTAKQDVIAGLAGDDTIRGEGRDDLICGGKGNDTVFGGRGIDLTFGQQGNDEIFGERGFFNQAVPGPGNDFVDGGSGPGGNEVIYLDATGPITGDLATGVITGLGHDEVENVQWLVGGPFDDTLSGTDDDDALFGADGDDTLESFAGNDFLAGGTGDDAIDGGDDFDFLGDYFFEENYFGTPPAGPITLDISTPNGTLTGNGSDALVGIDGGQGSTGNDVMIGNAQDNEFTFLNEGSDTVDAGAGDDLVDGGAGADDLDGGSGRDLLGNLDAPSGMTINLSTQTDSHNDTLAGFEDAWGTFFDDVITGTDGVNELQGIDGADQLDGLGGNDLLIGGWFDFVDPEVDDADGGAGTDECAAEVEANCEADPVFGASSRTLGTATAYGAAYRTGRW